MPQKNYKAHLAYNRKWNAAHSEQLHQARRLAQTRNKTYVLGYLTQHPCVDCGEKDPIVLEFDHRDPKEKCDNIAHLISTRSTIKIIEKEITKCDVRCANCHRRKTAKQFGYQKWPDKGNDQNGQ